MTATAEPTERPGAGGRGTTARHDGAKALLITVLGEFVEPAGGAVWTSTLVAAADILGVAEKNARQAIARIGDQGLIEPERHGRRVRWSLTADGAKLLRDGARRIYSFGDSPADWDGQWLVVYCPLADAGRSDRTRLRSGLRFMGFGELAPRLLISPHVDREPDLRRLIDEVEMANDCVVLRSSSGADDADWVARAWDLERLEAAYDVFLVAHRPVRPCGAEESFRAVVALVHDWRRFPSIDPELPSELLPAGWSGSVAERAFRTCHAEWSPAAHQWFRASERTADAMS